MEGPGGAADTRVRMVWPNEPPRGAKWGSEGVVAPRITAEASAARFVRDSGCMFSPLHFSYIQANETARDSLHDCGKKPRLYTELNPRAGAMGGDDQGDVTQLLAQWSQGDRGALDSLMPIVYAELRKIAGGYL